MNLKTNANPKSLKRNPSHQSLIVISRWRMDCTALTLRKLIGDLENWPQWCPHLLHAHFNDQKSKATLGASSALTYRNGFGNKVMIEITRIRSKHNHDLHHEIECKSTGKFKTHGLWVLHSDAGENSSNVVDISYRCELELDQVWMRNFTPFLRIIFSWYQSSFMKSSAKNMSKHLHCSNTKLTHWVISKR
jgi:hypothetical protein